MTPATEDQRLSRRTVLGWLGSTPAVALLPLSAAVSAWSLGAVSELAAGESCDLSETLPAGTKRGGTYMLAPESAPLTPGLTLSPCGVLTAAAGLSARIDGVVFEYQEPQEPQR